MNNKNLILVGFNQSVLKRIAKQVADALNMFFLDLDELIEYNIVSSSEALKKVGKKYLEKEERKTTVAAMEFENTIIKIDYQTFVNNYDVIKDKHKIFYVRISPENEIEKIALEEREKFLSSVCTETFNFFGYYDNIVKEIINYMGW